MIGWQPAAVMLLAALATGTANAQKLRMEDILKPYNAPSPPSYQPPPETPTTPSVGKPDEETAAYSITPACLDAWQSSRRIAVKSVPKLTQGSIQIVVNEQVWNLLDFQMKRGIVNAARCGLSPGPTIFSAQIEVLSDMTNRALAVSPGCGGLLFTCDFDLQAR